MSTTSVLHSFGTAGGDNRHGPQTRAREEAVRGEGATASDEPGCGAEPHVS